ncbi:hypothetical protein [Caenispirillum bisanense]|uniref:Uncharacterized protein n=1 Tax=Caenispirillum bisanense TaxID=414052 RepID=A0A286GYP2_9PROT|nr:hypothetical protein [Caenispirillum bisanense]SOE00627.1 hypothetical protein SAMN05421508_11370 [Caenispirillum bisanense]
MGKPLEFPPVGDIVFVPPGLQGPIKAKTALPCGGARLEVEQEKTGVVYVATIRVMPGSRVDISISAPEATNG